MRKYIDGIVLEGKAKALALINKFEPSKLDGKFHQLSTTATTNLNEIIWSLDNLISEAKYQEKNHQKDRLGHYRQIAYTLDLYENVVLAVLSRHHEDDAFMTSVLGQICREINYPRIPPVVTCLSQNYYCIYEGVNLLCVPLLEADFLLHLPDLYHELAHPIISSKNNPKIEPCQAHWKEFESNVKKKFDLDILNKRRSDAADLVVHLEFWQNCWLDSGQSGNWSIEFFCDLFALYTSGPSYAWAHFHLSTKKGGDPFKLPFYSRSSHPSDHARMLVLLEGLDRVGFHDEKNNIKERWIDYLDMEGYRNSHYFDYAYPTDLLILCANMAFEATLKLNCRIYKGHEQREITHLLNEAWGQFINSPFDYADWEKTKESNLRNKLMPKIN